MRPIKFRAWDKEAEHIVYSDKPEDSYVFGYEDGLLRAWYIEFVQTPDGGAEPRSEVLEPLMQFTGLVDKNGKEIYEGDLVENFDWEVDAQADNPLGVGAVEWDKEEARWAGLIGETFRVIGNIYENPERESTQPEKEG